MPERSGLKGTDLEPDYFPTGPFKTGVPHKITAIKKARELFVRVENAKQTVDCHLANPDLPESTEGRIGLRHMFTRSARYRNFRISKPDHAVEAAGAAEDLTQPRNCRGLDRGCQATSCRVP